MSKKVERKLQHVPIAEFQYRHEAELAAGFLSDAGIPYRLQVDDAGGAGMGLSMMNPSVLWVRALDAEVAHDLLQSEELDAEPPPVASDQTSRRAPSKPSGPLTVLERAVSGGLAVAVLATAANLPTTPLRTTWVALGTIGGLVLLGVALVGRAPGPLGRLIRMLAGSPPR